MTHRTWVSGTRGGTELCLVCVGTPELEEKTGLRVDAQHSRSTWGDTEDGQHVGLPACL